MAMMDTRMKASCFTTIVLVTCLLTGCFPTDITEGVRVIRETPTNIHSMATPHSVNPSPTREITHTTQPTRTATISISETAHPTPTLDNNINYQMVQIVPELPPEWIIPGKLFLQGFGEDPPYIYSFKEHTWLELSQGQSRFSNSPDGTLLAYRQASSTQSEEDLLVVERFDGTKINTIPYNEHWRVSTINLAWLDNSRLFFNLLEDLSGPFSVLPVEIVDVFTGKKQVIASGYPDLRPSGLGPGGMNFDFVTSTVFYHPSLNLVIYPKTTSDGFFVVLWDRINEQPLATIKDLGGFGDTPLWSPNGENFIVPITAKLVLDNPSNANHVEEWVEVNKLGNYRPLTHLGDYFHHADIWGASWSPNGRKLAFWITTAPDHCEEGDSLALLELPEKEFSIYCILGSMGAGIELLIWSPDSQYIATTAHGESDDQAIIINISEGSAAELSVNLYPSAWIISE